MKKWKIAVALGLALALSASTAFAGREVRLYKNAAIPSFGGRWYSSSTSKKAYATIDAVNNFESTSGGSVSTCLVNGGYSAVTSEYSISPGTRKRLPFKSGYGDEGQSYYLYMRSGYTNGSNFRANGSWCSDHKDQ